MRLFFAPILMAACFITPSLLAQPKRPKATTVFGIDLGATLAPCTNDVSLSELRAPCYQGKGDGSGQHVKFPGNKDPELGWVTATIIEGKVAAIFVSTGGYKTQVQDYDQLKNKFGKPLIFAPTTLQNRFGAKYEVISAKWKGDGYAVLFRAARDTTTLDGLDSGVVIIMTSAFDQSTKAEPSDRPQL